MGNEEKKEEQGKGFVVKDRRFSAHKETEEVSQTKEEKKEQEPQEEPAPSPEQEAPLPEINFASFIFSLTTSALIQLGEIPDPNTQQTARHLPSAKQTIDLISLLKEKTKGNLTQDEEKLIDAMLYDLKMRYVKAAG